MLLPLWQLFLFRGCGNTTSTTAGQLWEVSEQCFLWLRLAVVQHWPYTLGQVTPASPLHHILPIWPLAGPWLLSRCHQHLPTLCCAVISYHTFLLEVQTGFYNLNGQIWKNLKPEVSHVDPLAQACISVLSPAPVTLCNYTGEVSSSWSSAQEQCWTNLPFTENVSRICFSEVQTKPKTLAESHLRSPKQAQSLIQISSYSAEDTVRHSSRFKTQ